MKRKPERQKPISFGHAYAQSETFRALFQDGMNLVEETANYLDGDGRVAAKSLTRPASIVYATESMPPDDPPDAACVLASAAPVGQ